MERSNSKKTTLSTFCIFILSITEFSRLNDYEHRFELGIYVRLLGHEDDKRDLHSWKS